MADKTVAAFVLLVMIVAAMAIALSGPRPGERMPNPRPFIVIGGS